MKNKGMLIGIIILIVVIIIFISFRYYNKDIIKEQDLEEQIPKEIIKELHWNHMPITYVLSDCPETKTKRIMQSFDYIIDKTEGKIDFIEYKWEEGEYKPDLFIICEDERKDNGFVGSDGWYNVIPNTTIIEDATIFYYYGQHCVGQRPVEEIATILYVFGLEYAPRSEVNNIMNPLRCSAEITEKDLSYLNEIYD